MGIYQAIGVLADSVQSAALGFVLGGDVLMLAGVRPLLDRGLERHESDTASIVELEALRQDAWLRYNRLAFGATAVVGSIAVLRVLNKEPSATSRLVGTGVLFGILLRKQALDKQLRVTLTSIPAIGETADRDARPPARVQAALLAAAVAIVSGLTIVVPSLSRRSAP
ncbi:MAG: hypothetical protein ACR2PL_18430 [Dehalococcoidia bacterium]